MKNIELTSRDIWAARLGILSFIITIVLTLLSLMPLPHDGSFSTVIGSLNILGFVSGALLICCISGLPMRNVWARYLGIAGIVISWLWVLPAMQLPSWLFLSSSILVAASFSMVKISGWPLRVVVVGLWVGVLSQCVCISICSGYGYVERIKTLLTLLDYVSLASDLAKVCGFSIYIFRREGGNKNILWWFTESLLVLGVVVFIVDLFCATPRAGRTTMWGREGDLPWDIGLILQGTWIFIWCWLIRGFIHSQLRVKKCFDDANVQTKERGPVCLAVASGFFYVACVLCVMAFFWALFVDTYKFNDMLVSGIVGNMSLNLFNQMLRIKEVMNVRFYVTCSFLFCGWYAFGLAKLMSLMRENSAKAYSLKGKGDGTSDAQEA